MIYLSTDKLNMSNNIAELFSILKKELGSEQAIETVSDIVYNILDELEYNQIEVSDSNLAKLLDDKLKDYKKASKTNAA